MIYRVAIWKWMKDYESPLSLIIFPRLSHDNACGRLVGCRREPPKVSPYLSLDGWSRIAFRYYPTGLLPNPDIAFLANPSHC
jgi:hypothetical protein